MRARWLGVAGLVAWLAFVVVVGVVSDLDAGLVVLLGGLGVLVLAACGVGLLALRRFGALDRTLAALEGQVARAAAAPKPQAPKPQPLKLSSTEVERVARAVRRSVAPRFRRVEALQSLYSTLPFQHTLPAFSGFPATPDLLVVLLEMVDRRRPRTIVECGSGISTLCFARALQTYGIDGKVIALEHLEEYAEQTRELLARHGVDHLAEVRTAPLQDFEFGTDRTPWYAQRAWEDLADIDLLLVDGPPAKLGPLARYPALPLLGGRLAPDAEVVLDDFAREEERAVLERWQAEEPDRFTAQELPLERGAALLTFGSSTRS